MNQNFKRKGRKSGRDARFLKNAHKKGKEGDRGKGYKVDEDTYNYFLNVLKVKKKNEFESEEEKEAFIQNSLEQTVGHEVDYSKNQMLSRVLENLLENADNETLLRFCQAFTPQLRQVCADQFASHVLETLLQSILNNWIVDKELVEWFNNTCRFVLNNYEDFVFDQYANKVMRKVFCCLSGSQVGSQQQGSTKLEPRIPACVTKDSDKKNEELQEAYATVTKENAETLKDFCSQLMAWHQFNDMLSEVNTSGLVQILGQAMSLIDVTLANQLTVQTLKQIEASFSWDETVPLHLLENAIETSDRSTFEFILYKYFDGKLKDMTTHPKANHTLKKLIIACPSKLLFETIYDALQDSFEEIYKTNHTNMLVALAEGCRRYETKQSDFTKAMEKVLRAVHDNNTETSLVELLLADSTAKSTDSSDAEPGSGFASAVYNKSKILQCFLHFHKPTKVVNGILELGATKIVKLCTDVKGSRVIDEFFRSTTVGDKSKEKLLNMVQEDVVDLACSKFGSRVMDSIWSWCPLEQKVNIVKQLSNRVPKLNSDRFGRFFSEKAKVATYKMDPKQWEAEMKPKQKRTIVQVEAENQEEPAKKKKKKKKHQPEDDE